MEVHLRVIPLLAWCWSVSASAQDAPLLLHHQGRLLDAAGDPVTGAHAVTFRLWDAASGGTSAWNETDTLTFDAGYFAATLGDGTALTEAQIAGGLWLGIAVDAGAEIARVPVASVPYAIRARVAHDVRGGVADVTELRIDGDTVIAPDGSIDATALSIDGTTVIGADGSVDATELRVGGTTVVDGSGQLVAPIQGATLEGIGCTDGQYPVRRGGAWGCEPVVVDTTLDRATVRGFVTDAAIDLKAGSTLGGQALVTPATDQDVLGRLGCTDGTYPARTASGWACLATIDPDGLLSALACTDDQTLAWTGSAWDCASVVSVDTLQAGHVRTDTAELTGPLLLGAGTPADCATATEGAITYDFALRLLTVCDGTEWVPVGATSVVPIGGALRWSDGTLPTSCAGYARPPAGYLPATDDGLYVIDSDGAGSTAAATTHCLMSVDDGGWTLVQRTVWAWSSSSALRTTYASFYGTTVGSADSGAFRLSAVQWPALSADAEMLMVLRPRRADGQRCDPLYYVGTGGAWSVTPSATTLTGLTATVPMQAGTTLSATDSGPSATCLAPNNYGVPWFYTSCCSTCPTFQSSYWTDEPHPMASYPDTTPDLFQRTTAQVCGSQGPLRAQGDTYEGIDVMEFYLR